MKKISLFLAASLFAVTTISAQEAEPAAPVQPTQPVQSQPAPAQMQKPEMAPPAFTPQQVAGPSKETVTAFTKTYSYSAEDMKDAIIEKLKNEGLSMSKAKNNFCAFKESKYNALWAHTFDLYIAVNGSKTSGTIYLVISTGYDNYITDEDPMVNQKISNWLIAIENDIQTYIHNQKIEEQEDATKDAEKELNSLQKKKASIEKKIAANENEIKKFEAQRMVIDPANTSSIDPKLLEKEQKQADKLTEKKNRLQYDLDEINKKIADAEDKYNKQKSTLKELKANRP